MAHELGHNLYGVHDSAPCPGSMNYIMASSLGSNNIKLTNNWYFSPCTIGKFKSSLLDRNTTVSTKGKCLSNLPSDLPVENTFFNAFLPGQLWSANDQCKFISGYVNSKAMDCGSV
jgi:hypothetical protein